MGNAKLILLSSQFKGLTYELTEDQYSCGRMPDKAISIPDTTVSSYHCDFIKSGNSYIIRDRHSTNGTRVNNQPISEQLLSHTDLVTIGMVEALFEADDGTVIAPPKPVTNIEIKDNDSCTKTVVCLQPNTLGQRPKRGEGANSKYIAIVIILFVLVILALLGVVGWMLANR